jgi:hypothetical protein
MHKIDSVITLTHLKNNSKEVRVDIEFKHKIIGVTCSGGPMMVLQSFESFQEMAELAQQAIHFKAMQSTLDRFHGESDS